jgi:hypothetical protein
MLTKMNNYYKILIACLKDKTQMPIILFSVSEAVEWLSGQDREITEKGLRKAVERGDLGCIHVTESHYVLSQEDLEKFRDNPPQLGRPKKLTNRNYNDKI